MKTYALLDYDGYICKAYYAGLKEDKQEKVLADLEESAIVRTMEYFNVERDEVEVIKVISGHTFKKDIYPSYKLTRKKDENLGKFRDYIKDKYKDKLIKVSNLEADDVLILLHKHLNTEHINSIVFSDDKDLHYYSFRYCKLNTDKEVTENSLEAILNVYAQMLAGDSEDNIKGIPRMGMKTALKYIQDNMQSDLLKTVIKCYRDKGIDIDNCLRDILLVMPVGCMYINNEEHALLTSSLILAGCNNSELDKCVSKLIVDELTTLNAIVKEVYLDN